LYYAPQQSGHAVAVGKTQRALEECFGSHYWVRIQMPLVLDPDSEPEPDLAVVAGEPADYRAQHPQTALLVVEIADTSILRDRKIKGTIYAKGGIAEYWIVNLTSQTLEVYREPLDERFQNFPTLTAKQHITPIAQPSLSIYVADLLP
jgi:Uma2 family endonuclease